MTLPFARAAKEAPAGAAVTLDRARRAEAGGLLVDGFDRIASIFASVGEALAAPGEDFSTSAVAAD